MLRVRFFAPCLTAVLLASCSHLAARREARRPAMERASQAWRQMAAGQATEQVVADYDLAVAQVVDELSAGAAPKQWPVKLVLAGGHVLKVDQGGGAAHVAWSPRLFDALHARKGSRSTPVAQAVRAGLGAAVDGVREKHLNEGGGLFMHTKGQHLPVTAMIEFDTRSPAATLHLYDPREVQTVKVGGRRMKLAADFALPVKEVLNGHFFLTPMLTGLFRPERFQINQGLFLQEPYRADKVPVVFVHGLMSDPHIWENEVLSLVSDPEIGPKVQCWWFTYPTGLPVALSAMRLRDSMAQAQREFDPGGSDPGFKRTMMVGHSMGGLLTRMQVENSGDDFWHIWYKKPPSKVPLSETSLVLRKALIFEANPRITETVFIATPHRGASMADSWFARQAAKLIRAPQTVIQIATSLATLDVEMLNPDSLSLTGFGLTSVGSLSPRHPLFPVLNVRPMTAPCHSIIGNLGSTRPLMETSDGAVPYTSSHLDQAGSEKILPYWHGCVERIECAEEVRRLVREHLHGRN